MPARLRSLCLRSFAACLALGTLLAGVSGASAAPQDEGEAEAAVTEEAVGPLEALHKQRKYQDIILEVDALRAKAPKRFADAESEYWAGMAEARLKQSNAARERFLKLAQVYPEHERARDAGIEAAIRLIDQMDAAKDGKGGEEAAQKLAAQAAAEAEAVAKAHPEDAPRAARGLYVAGNCWRMAKDDKRAIAAYEACRTGYTTDEYGAKASYVLAALAVADLRPGDGRKLLADCATRWAKTGTAARCSKSLARLDVVDTPAPALEAQAWFVGAPVDLAAERGKVVLLWFFATWCPHCKQTMPEIADLQARFKDRPFKVVGFTFNSKEQTTEAVAEFVKDPKWHISYPVGVDLANGRTSDAFQAMAIPSAVLVDKKGVIRWADHPVYLTDELVNRLLAE